MLNLSAKSPFTLPPRRNVSPIIISASNDREHPIEIRIGLAGHMPRNTHVSRYQARAVAHTLLSIAEPLE